jgi:hypothetical protein
MAQRRSANDLKRTTLAEQKRSDSDAEALAERARQSTKTFKFIEAAAAVVGLAGVVIGWGFNLRAVLPIAGLLLIGGVLLLVLDWAGLISRQMKALLVTAVIGCYVIYIIVVGACALTSAIWNSPWPIRQVISNFMLPSRPPATAVRKPACDVAKEILGKLESVSLVTDASHRHDQDSALADLVQIWQLDLEYSSKTSFKTGKSVPLNPTALATNCTQRSQMLAKFRSSAKSVLDDWRAIVEALSKTESAVKSVKEIGGMGSFADNLNYNMQYWTDVRAELSDAIAIAEGKQDVASINPKTQTQMNVGSRLSGSLVSFGSLADAFQRLRLAWEQIEAGSCE